MKIAMPIWNERISPVMDTANQLLIIKIENGTELSQSIKTLPQRNMVHRVQFIISIGIDILICGAISRLLENILIHHGLKVIPWIKGDIEEIITAYLNGNLQKIDFNLPGCRRRCRQGKRSKQNKVVHKLNIKRYSQEDI